VPGRILGAESAVREIQLREAMLRDAGAVARVSVDSWRSTYRGLLPDELLARLSYDQRADNFRRELRAPDRPFAYVAEDRGRVVGYAMAGRERDSDPVYTGELYALYILQHYQGRGIGRSLMSAVATRLAADERHAMLVWVLSNNPARGFYESLGGKYLRARPLDLGGAVVEEVAYGWPDTIKLRTLTPPRPQ